MYKKCNLIIFLAVKLMAIWEQLFRDETAQQHDCYTGTYTLYLLTIALSFLLLSQSFLFPIVFQFRSKSAFISTGDPHFHMRKSLRCYGIWKTPIAKMIQEIPHWTVVLKKQPSHIAWVQPCPCCPLLESVLAQKEVAVTRGKQM